MRNLKIVSADLKLNVIKVIQCIIVRQIQIIASGDLFLSNINPAQTYLGEYKNAPF